MTEIFFLFFLSQLCQRNIYQHSQLPSTYSYQCGDKYYFIIYFIFPSLFLISLHCQVYHLCISGTLRLAFFFIQYFFSQIVCLYQFVCQDVISCYLLKCFCAFYEPAHKGLFSLALLKKTTTTNIYIICFFFSHLSKEQNKCTRCLVPHNAQNPSKNVYRH